MARRKAKKKSKSKAVARAKTKLPANWKEQLREDAQEEADRTPMGTGNTITLRKNGQFQFQGADMGEEIDVVILDHVFAKKYYDTEYDEDNPGPPACFALKVTQKNIAPHDNSPDAQSPTCEECWANEWASGRKRGKACADKNRLALLHSEDLTEDGSVILLEVPVTSGAAFNKYITGITKTADVPSYAVVTRMSMDEHADWQKLDFEYVSKLPDSLLGVPMSKRKLAREMLLEPYDTSGYDNKAGKGAKKKKKKKKKSKKKKTARKKRRRSRMS